MKRTEPIAPPQAIAARRRPRRRARLFLPWTGAVLVAALAAAPWARAQTAAPAESLRLGYVDFDRLTRESERFRGMMAEINETGRQYRERILANLEASETLARQLEEQESVLSAAEAQSRRDRLRALRSEAEDLEYEMEKLVRDSRADMVSPALDAAMRLVEEIGRDGDYACILNGEAGLFASDAVDLTPAVISRLDGKTAPLPTPPARPRIASVDFDRVVQFSRYFTTMVEEMNAQTRSSQAILDRDMERLQALTVRLEEQQSVLSRSELETRREEIARLRSEIEDRGFALNKSLRDFRALQLNPGLERAMILVGRIGREKEYDFIVNAESRLFASAASDLTSAVVTLMDALVANPALLESDTPLPLTGAAAASATGPAPRMAFVDFDRVARTARPFRVMVDAINEAAREYQERIDLNTGRYRRMALNLEEQRPYMTDAEIEARREELRRLRSQTEDLSYERERLIRNSRTETLHPVLEQAMAVVEQLGRAGGYAVVLTGDAVLFAAQDMDMTPAVVAALDSEAGAQTPAAADQPTRPADGPRLPTLQR